jgi:phosphoribosylformylglycinamidine synthase subunit PurS
MTEFMIEVHVTPRAGILDPQGKAVHHALHSLEFADVEDVRVGRLVRVRMKATSEDDARARADDMCKRLLANPVTEDYTISIGGT